MKAMFLTFSSVAFVNVTVTLQKCNINDEKYLMSNKILRAVKLVIITVWNVKLIELLLSFDFVQSK